jgi:hypothetical protein
MRAKQIFEFVRNQDPKKSLNLGIFGAITSYIIDIYGSNTSESEYIYQLIIDDELDQNNKKVWVEYLISEGYNYGDNTYSDFVDNDIDLVGSLPVGQLNYLPTENLTLIKKSNNNYIVEFESWTDFADYFEKNNYVSTKFISDILNGAGYSYFEFSDYITSVKDVIFFIKNNKSTIPIYEDLQELYIKLGGTNENNIEDLLHDIYEDDRFIELKDSINFAMLDTDRVAQEDAVYSDIIKTIKDNYDLGEAIWNDKCYQAKISKKGLEDLISSILDGDNLIYFRTKDYCSDLSPEVFNDSLHNGLSELM